MEYADIPQQLGRPEAKGEGPSRCFRFGILGQLYASGGFVWSKLVHIPCFFPFVGPEEDGGDT